MRSAYNGGGPGTGQQPGPVQTLIDGTTLAPDHWWRLI